MKKANNIRLEGEHGKPVMLDYCYKENGKQKPVVIFLHGFKGFKDWGHWDLMGETLAEAGLFFVKFNCSHNGTTPEKPFDFADLEAFGQNNFEKELADLGKVIDWLVAGEGLPEKELNTHNITIIGHSRGGGIAILKAQKDERIKQLVTLASVQRLDYAWHNQKALEKWEEKGVQYIWNSRTLQEMPLYYQLYENFKKHEGEFNVPSAAKALNKPYLIIHGDKDFAIPVEFAQKLKEWCPEAQLHIVKGANHVFGGKHPYGSKVLPQHTHETIKTIIRFLKLHR